MIDESLNVAEYRPIANAHGTANATWAGTRVLRDLTRASATCVEPRSQRPSVVVAKDDSPEGKPLQTTSFAIHATRGILRDQKTRRRVMVMVLTAALVLMISGVTFLRAALDPHEHPFWFIFFWLVCAWLTITAILLSIFDLLMLTRSARDAQRQLRQDMDRQSTSSNQ